jgi:CopG family nickel-responsive transcriptional regulator
MSVTRFGVSLEQELILAFDKLIRQQGYSNRSEAIRDLIRKELLHTTKARGGTIAGAVVMTYDHHKRELVDKLLDIQHDYQKTILSTQHIHLDHHHCLEIIAVKGKAADIESLAHRLQIQVGVKHVDFTLAATGKETR